MSSLQMTTPPTADQGCIKPPGSCLSREEKLCLSLAVAYQRQKDPTRIFSYANQVKAEAYLKAHGLKKTRAHLAKLQKQVCPT